MNSHAGLQMRVAVPAHVVLPLINIRRRLLGLPD